MTKALKYSVIIAIAAIAVFIGWQAYRHLQRPEEIVVLPSRAQDVKEMVRLCSMEIYNEVPVLDTVNLKVMFAVQKQSSSITFDLEHPDIDDTGDTVRVTLPREIVEIHESTEKNSWQVIDTKAIGPMALIRSDKFTPEEENLVKAKLKARSISRLYSNGTVRQARKDAAENLAKLLEAAYQKPVKVYDPTPEGIQK